MEKINKYKNYIIGLILIILLAIVFSKCGGKKIVTDFIHKNEYLITIDSLNIKLKKSQRLQDSLNRLTEATKQEVIYSKKDFKNITEQNVRISEDKLKTTVYNDTLTLDERKRFWTDEFKNPRYRR